MTEARAKNEKVRTIISLFALRRARVRLLRIILRQRTKDPHKALKRLERGSANATLWIFVGIVVETCGLIWFVRDWLEASIAIVGNALIGYGLIVEYVLILRALVASAAVQREADLKVANANARAAEANKKAREAQLELAKYRAPRTLSLAQQGRIASKIRHFGNLQFDAATAMGDAEALGLLEMIEGAILAAGWEMIDWADAPGLPGTPIVAHRPGRSRLGNTAIQGVLVQFEAEQRSRLESAANALASALVAEEIPAVARANMQGAITAANTTAIHIHVGPKV